MQHANDPGINPLYIQEKPPPMQKPPGMDPKLKWCCIIPIVGLALFFILNTWMVMREIAPMQLTTARELQGEVNTAELKYFRRHGVYADFDILAQEGMLEGVINPAGNLQGELGVEVEIELATDGKSYKLRSKTAGMLITSDQTGRVEVNEAP